MPKQGAPEPIRLLNKVPVIEQPGELPLVDIREAIPELVIARPKVVPFLRPAVVKMLKHALSLLPEGMKMGVFEAWRPISRQKEIWDSYYARLQKEHPEWSNAMLRRQVNRFLAPYDQKAPPGHSTGGAVDVTIYDSNGDRLDFTSPFSGLKSAYTYRKGLTPTAQRNRDLLLRVMFDAGFSNCRDEFWHYSYGDAAWAVRTGAAYCIYDKVDLPEDLYPDYANLPDGPKPFE